MRRLFNAITATTRTEIPMNFERARQVILAHHISGGPATGGYVSIRLREMTVEDALVKKTAVTITTAERDALNVVTVTATAHGLSVGDIAVIRNIRYSGATDFNGEYVVASAADANTFTYAQTGAADATGAGGRVYAIKQVPLYTDGANIKTAATTASYACTYTGIKGVLEITCNITDGTHTVWMDDCEGVGAGNLSDLQIGAVELKDGATDNRAAVDTLGSLTTRPSVGALTDKSGTCTLADTSYAVAAANATRKFLFFQNISDTDMWINFGVAAVKDSPSIKIGAGGEAYSLEGGFVSNQAVNVICGAGGKKWTAKEG